MNIRKNTTVNAKESVSEGHIISKDSIINEYKISENDTGSAQVQIALLTHEINDLLANHFSMHKKDKHSKRGFLAKISKRKKLCAYLKRKDEKSYLEIIKSLGLRK